MKQELEPNPIEVIDKNLLVEELKSNGASEYLLHLLTASKLFQKGNIQYQESWDLASEFITRLRDSDRIASCPQISNFHSQLYQRISADPEAVYLEIGELYNHTVLPQGS